MGELHDEDKGGRHDTHQHQLDEGRQLEEGRHTDAAQDPADVHVGRQLARQVMIRVQ